MVKNFFVVVLLLFLASCQSYTFEPVTKIIHDADDAQVIILQYTGPLKELEPIVFSINRYGDASIDAQYTSLEQMGAGTTVASSSPLSSLPIWANSILSTNEKEKLQNQEFRTHLIEQGVLTENFTLTKRYDQRAASIVFYLSEFEGSWKNSDVHENSHTFFHNLPQYRESSIDVYDSLDRQQQSCLITYLEENAYAVDHDNIADEFVAHAVEQSPLLSHCFEFSSDFNEDGVTSDQEKYLWETHH